MSKKTNLFVNLNADFASGLVVFLVALPLCLGIALASGAPLFSGIISGIVGGIVVGFLSQSHLSVSGPAAGLTAIVLAAITDLGAFDLFLTAGLIAGFIQLVLGFAKAGTISNFVPVNVIEGMLAGIGIIIFLKQIPKALGSDVSVGSGLKIFNDVAASFDDLKIGVVIVTAVSLAIILIWNKIPALSSIKLLPAALIAVTVGVLINEFILKGTSLEITSKYLVSLPVPQSLDEFKAIIVTPNFGAFTNPKVWTVAATIAIVASIETLLCIEAADQMDAQKRETDTNVELKAQGIGNMISALLGGLPMTSVVVRTSANNNAGAKSKMSAIIHGVLLLISVLTIPVLLNKIPFATLAAILLLIGYKLANPKVFIHFWSEGIYQFIPFVATCLAVVFLDLLKGVALGMILSLLFIFLRKYKRGFTVENVGNNLKILFNEEVSFLNKSALKSALSTIKNDSNVVIDGTNIKYITNDIIDLLHEFKNQKSKDQNLKVELIGLEKKH